MEIRPPKTETGEIPLIRPSDKTRDDVGIGGDAEALLRDVIDHPTDGVAQRFRRRGLSVLRGYGLVERLTTKGILRSAMINTPWAQRGFYTPIITQLPNSPQR